MKTSNWFYSKQKKMTQMSRIRAFCYGLILSVSLSSPAMAVQGTDTSLPDQNITASDKLSRIKIYSQNADQLRNELEQAGYDVLESSESGGTIELIVSPQELATLKGKGLSLEVIEVGRPFNEVLKQTSPQSNLQGQQLAAVPGYMDLAALNARMQQIANAYPAIAQVVDLTTTYNAPTTVQGRHLYALKISDNVATAENEPSALIVSNHHARELVTPVIALNAMDKFTSQYGINAQITAAVDNNEIWIAPTWNPDGYNHVFTSDNMWRKNRRVFSGGTGVDTNRNYPQGWSSCSSGSTNPSTNTYKGPSPASEAETQTMILWSEAERFSRVIDFHSSGRETLYGYAPCWSYPFTSWMQQEAVSLSNAGGYNGANRPPSSNGEHYQWQFAKMGAYAFLIETATEFQPPFSSAEQEAAQLWPAVLQAVERPVSIYGTVTDSGGNPVTADIQLLNTTFSNGETNKSGGNFSKYHFTLPADTYQLRFTATNFDPIDRTVVVTAGSSEQLNIQFPLAANQAPITNAGADGNVQIPNAVNLNGSVTDDNFPGNPLTITWSKVSGPGVVTFADASSASTTATFDTAGSYSLRLTANDVEFSVSDDTVITVAAPPQNQAPVVSAGADQNITLPASASLNGSVSDDGLPVGASVSSTWTKVSGPGTVSFANASAPSTSASFSVDGSYVLRLTADDTALSASDDVAITVNAAPPNDPPVFTSSPVVKADAVENTAYSDSIAGNATDPENDALTFSKVSGPAWLSIASDGALFGTPGNADVGLNSFSIQVSDAQNNTSGTLNINVLDASSTPVVIESQGFESGLGNWANVTVGDQENWTRDSGGTASSGTGPNTGDNSTWYIYLETSSAEAFTAGETAILEGPTLSASNRTLTFSYHMYGLDMGTLNVDVFNAGSWTNAVWSLTGQQQTSNAAAYAKATVNLASFSGDIKIRFRAVAAGGYRGDVAIDNIEVTGIVGPPVNQAPSVNAGADQTINTTSTNLNGSVTDDGLGGTLTSNWSKVSGPGSVTFANASSANTSADFSALGVYVLRLSASDTQLSSLDDVQVTVLDPSSTPIVLESQGFETSMGNWINVTAGDQENWTRDSGGTASSGTGPNTGDSSTWYMYLETSSAEAYTAGETAILEGPSINGSNRSLKFSYHMYGLNMGTLNVDVFSGGSWTNGVWSKTGQQHSSNAAAYLSSGDIDLSAYSGAIKIRFRGVAAGGYRGDMAIDNIEIKGLQ